MRNILKTALIAATLALAGAAANVAQAETLELQLGPDGPRMLMRDDCNPYRERCRGEDRRYDDRRYDDRRYYDRRPDDRGWARRECAPQRAVAKAERMGIRRARIVDVGRRTIDVSGRSRYGERVVVSFGRWDRSCPLYR
ncbi:hypothetical protein ASD64_03500 [Mesorhizobium sp. Root157]|uniref:hypothetical protein n=1 Tax=Mesorhizobium sp. Root157 TaxID=1736477 RepID=UPI0006F3D114|nr:hypothetical protein [Mesorhizobium sp. Root157]KQZ93970.1 hypothetical protein ASD64_03500 [Mesorhizobium sp. Root157]